MSGGVPHYTQLDPDLKAAWLAINDQAQAVCSGHPARRRSEPKPSSPITATVANREAVVFVLCIAALLIVAVLAAYGVL